VIIPSSPPVLLSSPALRMPGRAAAAVGDRRALTNFITSESCHQFSMGRMASFCLHARVSSREMTFFLLTRCPKN